jgi:hypothetical protein
VARVLAVGGVRFVLAGVLAAALAACFAGRADAASVFSSSLANSAASAPSVVAGDRALTLKWSAVKGAAGYRVSWRGRVLKGGKPTAAWSKTWLGLKVLTASARSYKPSGLVNGREYQLRLESNTKAKKSRWGVESILVGSPAATVPGAPTSVSGVARDASVAVSWLAPSSNGGSAITAYIVTALGPGNSAGCYTTGALSCSVDGLTNGTPYTFTVKATNARGGSLASATSDAVTPGSWNVGDVGPGGGKVFYAPGGTFTETGAACGSSCRYLEAAPAGWNAGGSPDPNLQWGGGDGTAGQCSNRTIAGAAGTAIGSGKANTAAIMADCPDSSGNNSAPAALAASTYAPAVNGAVVHGWFLPSRDELDELDFSAVGEFAPGSDFWSSSQWDGRDGLYLIVAYCSPSSPPSHCGNGGNAPKHIDKGVRPVRAF